MVRTDRCQPRLGLVNISASVDELIEAAMAKLREAILTVPEAAYVAGVTERIVNRVAARA